MVKIKKAFYDYSKIVDEFFCVLLPLLLCFGCNNHEVFLMWSLKYLSLFVSPPYAPFVSLSLAHFVSLSLVYPL